MKSDVITVQIAQIEDDLVQQTRWTGRYNKRTNLLDNLVNAGKDTDPAVHFCRYDGVTCNSTATMDDIVMARHFRETGLLKGKHVQVMGHKNWFMALYAAQKLQPASVNFKQYCMLPGQEFAGLAYDSQMATYLFMSYCMNNNKTFADFLEKNPDEPKSLGVPESFTFNGVPLAYCSTHMPKPEVIIAERDTFMRPVHAEVMHAMTEAPVFFAEYEKDASHKCVVTTPGKKVKLAIVREYEVPMGDGAGLQMFNISLKGQNGIEWFDRKGEIFVRRYLKRYPA